MRFTLIKVLIVLIALDMILADHGGEKKEKKTIRRGKKKKDKSTSSSQTKDDTSVADGDSLDLSSSGSTSSSSRSRSERSKKSQKYKQRSTEERTGWKKWHRKCTPCPEDMRKKWRDPSIAWICGAYQRARRSFKSSCLMRYRNCQDGTMFEKIHDHRCNNDSASDMRKNGEHFLYDYKASLTDDSTSSTSDSSETSSNSDWKRNWHLD